ncbi:MAG: hypothetical protein IPK70_05165 [Flavobacteriales bacterium]|nr:hypothetical protein [Flavobacteriales bacterium]
MEAATVDRALGPRVQELLENLLDRYEMRRTALLPLREKRRAALSSGDVAHLPDTAHVRSTEWRIDPVPEQLLERRVELIGGCTRSELINGLNAGAKSYVADLWNFTCGDAWSVMRAHRVLERATRSDIAYLDPYEGRVRANPRSTTRLLIGPRPLHVLEPSVLVRGEPSPAAFLDLALLGTHALQLLTERQGGLYLLLRDVQGHMEARLWTQLLDEVEQCADLPRGSIRATVMIDSLAGALEADEILFELMHHAAGLSIDPQGYAADHIAIFHGPDSPVFPDRESVGLNAPFLRALSLHLIAVCHRRGAHAIGAPSFVLPPLDPARVKADYQEMLNDKEREAADGFDGTMVVHADTVNAAMAQFNKMMPLAHQLGYQRDTAIAPADLIRRPEGAITVDSLVTAIRTTLRCLVFRWQGKAWVVQGSRLHDRSSLRLALRLLWHWCHSRNGVVTATGLEIHGELIGYLLRKESDKLFAEGDDRTKALAKQAVQLALDLVLGDAVPLEPQA